jgi:hypothetical protein
VTLVASRSGTVWSAGIPLFCYTATPPGSNAPTIALEDRVGSRAGEVSAERAGIVWQKLEGHDAGVSPIFTTESVASRQSAD